MINHRNNCRGCHSANVMKVISLGDSALAGGFIHKEDIPKERKFPLEVYFCKDCSLVQLLDLVPPDVLFKDYRYLSSVSNTMKNHFIDYAKALKEKYSLTNDSLVVEFGSNDGVLLKPLQDIGVKCLGVEPAANIAKVAMERGLDVIVDYFSESLAKEIIKKYGKADIITGNNVFAHIDDIDGVMNAVVSLLKDDGSYVFQVHYLVDLIQKMQYDTIYHEHFCYYSVKALQTLMERFGMEIFHVDRVSLHEGSIRVHAKKISSRKNNVDETVAGLIKLEESLGLFSEKAYMDFEKKMQKSRKDLVDMLVRLKKEGKKLVGYGAPGRGTTLVNYCKIDSKLLDYTTDESPERVGRVMPGTHIPIIHVSKFREDSKMPDYALMLAWSYKKEILGKEKTFLEKGGKFIVPLPSIQVISSKDAL
ncbi:MAG TPA: class I SAM-dependent methyltransferase [Candidatus Nanoarchaeia archaeon]|nr:class I SAM-dependent methyltransferase [Candidatus Nanoarchaeia archaeon]